MRLHDDPLPTYKLSDSRPNINPPVLESEVTLIRPWSCDCPPPPDPVPPIEFVEVLDDDFSPLDLVPVVDNSSTHPFFRLSSIVSLDWFTSRFCPITDSVPPPDPSPPVPDLSPRVTELEAQVRSLSSQNADLADRLRACQTDVTRLRSERDSARSRALTDLQDRRLKSISDFFANVPDGRVMVVQNRPPARGIHGQNGVGYWSFPF